MIRCISDLVVALPRPLQQLSPGAKPRRDEPCRKDRFPFLPNVIVEIELLIDPAGAVLAQKREDYLASVPIRGHAVGKSAAVPRGWSLSNIAN